jgi:hypothetical protein
LAIRLRVKLKALKGTNPANVIETVGIANTGYEAEGFEIAIPEALARRIGFLPELPQGTKVENYISALGSGQVHVVPQALEVEVGASGKVKEPVVADAVITNTDEVLLSDRIIERLNVVLEKPGSGFWRFSDESPSALRGSETPEKW